MQQQQDTADGQVLQQTEYLYEPGSFRPMAQVTHHNQGSELHYIVTDHAGTPKSCVMSKVILSGGESKRCGAITTGNHNATGSVLSDVLLWNIDFSEAK